MTNHSARQDLELEEFLEIFLQNTPIMDVRAPVEFAAGAFPGAVNVPLLDDDQRHLVGLEYAQQGQDAAVDLGHKLASPEVRAQRLNSWKKFISAHPDGYLYCFRGGLRSTTTQAWLADSGCEYPLIQGGYKAMRGFLLGQLQRLCDKGNIILLAGATGVGKTELITARSSAIDLEGRANHRGSAFGKTFSEQPSQIDWENQIIVDWLRCEADSDLPVLIEAESNMIGRIHLPTPLQEAMARAPVLALEASLQDRTQRLFNDYVVLNLQHFQNAETETEQAPWDALNANILENLTRIRKRLGGLHYQQLCEILPNAVELLRGHSDQSGFIRIISILLENYYDISYRHHMDQNRSRIKFTGSMSEISAWLEQHTMPVVGQAVDHDQVVR